MDLVRQPGLVIRQHPRVERHVLRAQVRLLLWLPEPTPDPSPPRIGL